MTQFDLLDFRPEAPLPEAPYVRSSQTSKEAAERIRPSLGMLEAKVLEAIKAAGSRGLVCDEAERITGLTHQCCSARFRGLEQRGLIRRTEDKRPTRSGRSAAVYLVSEVAA